MKRVICMLLILTFCLMPLSAMAATDVPVITVQPQSPCYPEYSVAIYTVKAEGKNLKATWYIEYEGKTYNASQIGGTMQPWEAYAGESYGARQPDGNTFTFVFEGIEKELDGAEIWCEIEDGHYDIVSQIGHIAVGNYGSPPEILSIPASITVKQGEEAEIRCIAKSSDGSQLDFIWYETGTGKFEDLQAVNRGTETSDYMFCDTGTLGTCYYVCGITTSGGGRAYSSMVEVNVVEKSAAPAVQATEPTPEPTTEATTEATGEVTTPATEPTAEPTTEPATQTEQPKKATPWWVLVLVGLGAAGIGVGVAVVLIKKK